MSWRGSNPSDRRLADLWAGVTVVALLLAPTALWLLPMTPPCPVHALTGWPCPSCGSSRAVLALFEGRVFAAVELNPLFVLSAAALLATGLLVPVWVRCGGPAPATVVRLPGSVRIALVLAIVANWAYLVARAV